MLARLLRAPTATMDITRTRARLMATTGQAGSPAASSSAPARGSTAFMGALAFTGVPASTAIPVSMAGLVSGLARTLADLPTSDAGRLAADSTVATRMEALRGVAFTAADAGRLRR